LNSLVIATITPFAAAHLGGRELPFHVQRPIARTDAAKAAADRPAFARGLALATSSWWLLKSFVAHPNLVIRAE
jgi:hypothetical protein